MDRAGGNQLARRSRPLSPHPLGRGKSGLLELPDAPGGEALALRALADPDHGVGGEEGVGHPLDLGCRRSAREQVGHRLNRLAPVEVGDPRRNRTVYLPGRDRAG